MRTATTILFLFFLHKLNATTYYVSNAGNDANNGLTPATSWETLGKINISTTSGDTVKLKCNDTWIATTKLRPQSGIYYTSYSTGNKPLITGFVSASFGAPSSNIYTATATGTAVRQNTVTVNGIIRAKGRYPNSTYSEFAGYIGDSIINTSLTGTPSYVGKEIVIRVSNWVIDTTRVQAQNTGELKVFPKTTYPAGQFGGNGYFFQNDESFLDAQNEWSLNSGVLKVYSTTLPTVQYSTVDTLVWVRNKTNITIDGIAFTGANVTALQLDTCSNVTIKNCNINNCGTNGVTAVKSNHTTISNDSIQNCMNGAVYMRNPVATTPMIDTCNNTAVYNNYIHNIGIYPGMGVSGNGRYNAINIVGDSSVIQNNLIDSVGYMPIQFNGRGSLVYHNYANQFCITKADGGGIYSVVGSYIPEDYNVGSIIRGNIVRNGIGNHDGMQDTASFNPGAAGIYLDDNNNNITIDSNTTENTRFAGFLLNTGYDVTVRNNTFASYTGGVYRLNGDEASYGLVLKHNIYYESNPFFPICRMGGGVEQNSDSNYFLRPLLPTDIIAVNGVPMTLTQYQILTGFDAHSQQISNIIDSVGILYFNPSSTPITIELPTEDNYRDVYGNIYLTTVVIPVWGSRLLFKSTTELFKSQHYVPH